LKHPKLNRKGLSVLIFAMFGSLILAFAVVLLRFSGGVPQTPRLTDTFAQLRSGQTVLQRLNGDPVWVSRLSESQRQQAKTNEGYLLKPESGCAPATELCALVASTDRDGVVIRFTHAIPPQLPAESVWFGGFVNPLNGATFDLLGRAYRLHNGSDLTAEDGLLVVPVD
jgi:hypothetical protein